MRLSEAIRLGAMLKPQGFGAGSAILNDVSPTCALGAAADACGLETGYHAYEKWRFLGNAAPPCPGCGCDAAARDYCVSDIGDVVWHLNDEHKWTREAIADWVETIEAQQGQQGEADGAVLELREVITLAQKVSA